MMNRIEPAISLLVKEQDEMWIRSHIGGSIPNFQAEALFEEGKIMLGLGRLEEAVNDLEDALARVYRDPHFKIEMYELWATSIYKLMLQALETGQEDRAHELYLKFRKIYDSLKGWRIREVKNGIFILCIYYTGRNRGS